MHKENESKLLTSIYIIIVLLIINVICNIVIISKTSTKETTKNDTNIKTSEETNYDVSMFTSLLPADIFKKINNGDEFVLYIGQEQCTYCQKMLPTLQQAQKNYGYETVYLNVASSSVTNSKEYSEMAKLLNVKKTSNGETKEFGEFKVTPMVAVLNKGKMVDGMIGYNTYDNFASFLEKSGIKKK